MGNSQKPQEKISKWKPWVETISQQNHKYFCKENTAAVFCLISHTECLTAWTASMTVWRRSVSAWTAVVGARYTVSRAWRPSSVSSLTVMASRCWRSRSLSCWFSRLRSSRCFFSACRCSRAALQRCSTCCNSGYKHVSCRITRIQEVKKPEKHTLTEAVTEFLHTLQIWDSFMKRPTLTFSKEDDDGKLF